MTLTQTQCTVHMQIFLLCVVPIKLVPTSKAGPNQVGPIEEKTQYIGNKSSPNNTSTPKEKELRRGLQSASVENAPEC